MVRKIFLTVDDGPSNHFDSLLNYLFKLNIGAVFFCQGFNLHDKRNRSILIKAIRRGYIIANHTFNHPKISKLTLDEFKSEVLSTEKIINSLYASAKIERQHKLFRFPFFDNLNFDASKMEDFLAEIGLLQLKSSSFYILNNQVICCTMNSNDYKIYGYRNKLVINSYYMYLRLKLGLRFWLYKHNPEILLMHDHQNNRLFFKKLIDSYRYMGFKFMSPDDINDLLSTKK